MASISSLSGSSSTSVSAYSNMNAITGLASGIDSEAIIEQLVSTYESKISTLQQSQTKVEWQQEAYRDIIDVVADFMEKYTDYTSDSNMTLGSFFDSASVTTASGANASKVSISGSATSNLSILGVKQLATAATYTAKAADSAGNTWDKSSTLKDMLGDDGLSALGDDYKRTVTTTDAEGNEVITTQYKLEINGKEVGWYTEDTSLDTIMTDINKSGAGVSLNYSSLTGYFQFTASEIGEGDITMGGGLASALFSTEAKATAGTDAVYTVSANGGVKEMTSSSNKVVLDGMTVNLKGTFGEYNDTKDANGEYGLKDTNTAEAIVFTTSTDSSNIINSVKSMIEDYNAMVKAIRSAYTTQPLTDSSGDKYDPLTEEEEADMSDSAIERYNTKAKTGLLYQDQDLSAFYTSLVSTITSHVNELADLGIETSYSDGLTTLTLDESKLTSALEENADKVKNTFTSYMGDVKKVTEQYCKTTGALTSKGILVQKAGTERSSMTINENTLKSKIDSIQEQIDKWKEKLSDKIDFYSRQFTNLETLISNMNSVSSALAGLTGG